MPDPVGEFIARWLENEIGVEGQATVARALASETQEGVLNEGGLLARLLGVINGPASAENP